MPNYTGNPDNGLKLTLDLPHDATKPKSDEFNKVLGPMLDNIAYLNARGVQGSGIVVCTLTNIGSQVVGPTSSGGTWQDFPSVNGFQPYLEVPDCQLTDKLICFMTARMSIVGQTQADVRFLAEEDASGTPVRAAFQGSTTRIVSATDDGELVFMVGQRVIQNPGLCRVWLQGKNSASGATQVGFSPGQITTTQIVVRIRSYELL